MMSSYKDHLDFNNFDDEEDLTDDEVFTRGGKSIPLEENGVNKPLMAPRHRGRNDNLQTKVRKVPPCRVLWAPLLYGFIALSAIIGIICLIVFLINTFMIPLSLQNKLVLNHKRKMTVPCTNITIEDVWVHTFPMLTTETAVRLNDVNLDDVPDVIMGFGTGADSFNYPKVVCDVYFPPHKECGGGILALDGNSGHELWRHYTLHEIFAINCNIDIDKDGVKDCLGGGRMAGFIALSGRDGSLLWKFNDTKVKIPTSNFYTPIYIRDLDHDTIPDIITIHGGDPLKEPGSEKRLVGRILVISSKTGKVLQWVEVPDGKESYYSPQIYTQPDGTELLLFGTGGETHGGSLWCIKVEDLLKGNISMAKQIYTDHQKGIMTPPVLVDITGDGIIDIVMAMFNSKVIAFNGIDFKQIWSFHIPSSESYSTPGVGFFNNDDIPDFIINYQIGPGFPIYYYTETTILDGRNGKPLLDNPIKMVVGTQTSPLVISLEGFGNDIFLYWISDCNGKRKNQNLEYDFIKGTSVHEQSRADFCKIRFKENLFTKMFGLTSKMSPPGVNIYDSDSRKAIEFGNQLNYTAIGLSFKRKQLNHYRNHHMYNSNSRYKQTNNAKYKSYELNHHPDYYQHHLPNDEYFKDSRYPLNSYAEEPVDNDDLENINQRIFSPEDEQTYNQNPSAYYPKKYNDYDKNGPIDDYRYEEENKEPDNENMKNYYSKDVSSRSENNWKGWYNEEHPKIYHRGQNRHNYWKERRPYRKTEENVKENYKNNSPKQRAKNGKVWKRFKKHVGPHDAGGIQRTISTGALFPIRKGMQSENSIDIVFATFWFYPAHTQALLPEDIECIKNRLAQEKERFHHQSDYYGMDHDEYEAAIRTECLRKNNHYVDANKSVYDNFEDYDPFDRRMGQMTVYRLRISCHCLKQNLTSDAKCAKILPYAQQGWTAYMGMHGNCLFNPHQFT
ncbi:uncharacterized protein [Centruroides vittatus]|uniref:uncharacterized protein n=1 Tax=Centruroides vittatus TaxID=120091 RepID=UPI003510B02E